MYWRMKKCFCSIKLVPKQDMHFNMHMCCCCQWTQTSSCFVSCVFCVLRSHSLISPQVLHRKGFIKLALKHGQVELHLGCSEVCSYHIPLILCIFLHVSFFPGLSWFQSFPSEKTSCLIKWKIPAVLHSGGCRWDTSTASDVLCAQSLYHITLWFLTNRTGCRASWEQHYLCSTPVGFSSTALV